MQGEAGVPSSLALKALHLLLNGVQVFAETSHSDLGHHACQGKDGNLYLLGFNQSNINSNKLQNKKLFAVVKAKLLSPT